MSKLIIEVMPKQELLDPQGKATARALQRAGFAEFTDVRVGKRFELTVDGEITPEVLERAHKVAAEILSNDVIEDVVSVKQVTAPRVSNDGAAGESGAA